MKRWPPERASALAQRFERRERAGADRLLERLAERFDELAGPSADGALAAFVSNEGAFVCNLDRHVEPIVVVGDAFLVRPLLKELGFGSRYLLLGLSADRFALIRGSFGSLERVKLPADVPGTYSEEFPDVYDGRPGAPRTTRPSRTTCRPTTATNRATT